MSFSPTDVNQDVYGAPDVRHDGPVWQFDPALQDAICEASDGLAGRIGMEGTETPCMSCVQCLEQIEGFSTTHLAHDDSVRPVTQRCLQQVADGHQTRTTIPLIVCCGSQGRA